MIPYRAILIDPPWRWKNYNSTELVKRGEKWGRARARAPYDCMDTVDIAALPIADLCDKDTLLFCWATEPKQEEAYQVLRAWGFTPVTTVFTWVKLTRQAFRNYEKWRAAGRDLQWILDHLFHVGSGFWTRKNTEVVLLGRRKGGRQGEIRKDQRGLVITPVGAHSVKPVEVHRRIERMCGDVPRIELFARRVVPGWHAIGNGIDGLDIRESLARVVQGLPLPGVSALSARWPLSRQQETLLRALAEQDEGAGVPWRPGVDAEEWTAARRASVSRSLAGLERQGLAVRNRPGGRTLSVSLTEAGREAAGLLTAVDSGQAPVNKGGNPAPG